MSVTPRENLASAIGEVAMASAEVEDAVRIALYKLIGDDFNWWLFEGQPLDTLLTWVKRAIDEFQEARQPWDAHVVAQTEALLGRIRQLASIRNDVIHGAWSNESLCRHPDDVAWGQQSRPWGGTVGSDAWFCRRSKRGGAKFLEQPFALDDLRRLAAELITCRDDLWGDPLFETKWVTKPS